MKQVIFCTMALAALPMAGLVRIAATEPDGAKGPAFKIADLAWIAGRWEDTKGRTPIIEIWGPPYHDAMQGMCRIGRNINTAMLELMTIEESGEGVFLRMLHFRPGLQAAHAQPWSYQLTRLDGQKATFENPKTEHHRRIVYERKDKSLVIRLENSPDPKKSAQEIPLQRAGD